MDLSKLTDLKSKLQSAKEFIKVWEFFLDHFGEKPAFIKLGHQVRDEFLETIFAQVARQLFHGDVDWNQIIFTGLPEHHFIHGGGIVNGGLLNVLYFDDIQVGLLCGTMPFKSNEVKFARFSGRKLPGSADPSVN
jgi:hypothetical protein